MLYSVVIIVSNVITKKDGPKNYHVELTNIPYAFDPPQRFTSRMYKK